MENAISQASILFPHWNIPRSNSLNLGGTIGNFHIWQEKHYQEAAKVAKLVYKELEHPIRRPLLPYQLWDGDLRIMELLQELWDQFFNTVYSLRQERFFAMEEMPSFINVRRLYELLTPYYTQLAAMQVHFTGYPFSVEYVVAPVSAVVSVPA